MKVSINNIATKLVNELLNSEYKDFDMYKCIRSGVFSTLNIYFECDVTYFRVCTLVDREVKLINNELYSLIFPTVIHK